MPKSTRFQLKLNTKSVRITHPDALFLLMDKINEDLDKGLVRPQILLSGVRLIDELSRDTPEFTDKRYLPFYYHLGKQVEPSSVLQIGPKLGLPAVCFLRSCLTVDRWTIIGEFNRFVKSNMKLMDLDVEFCNSTGDEFDLALFSEQGSRKDLDLLWSQLKQEGLLIVDYIDSDAQGNSFYEFCRVVNREPIVFKTRNGVGIIRK